MSSLRDGQQYTLAQVGRVCSTEIDRRIGRDDKRLNWVPILQIRVPPKFCHGSQQPVTPGSHLMSPFGKGETDCARSMGSQDLGD